MASSINMQPLRIETLTPQIHGFIRAYIWQVYRGTDPVVGDDPDQQTALQVARVMVRLYGPDRELLRRMTQELAAYMHAAAPRPDGPSEPFQKLMAQLGGATSEPAAAPEAVSKAAPKAAPEAAPVEEEPISQEAQFVQQAPISQEAPFAQKAPRADEVTHEAPPPVIHSMPVHRDLAEPSPVEQQPFTPAQIPVETAPEPATEIETEVEPPPAPLSEEPAGVPEVAVLAFAEPAQKGDAQDEEGASSERAHEEAPSPSEKDSHSDEPANS